MWIVHAIRQDGIREMDWCKVSGKKSLNLSKYKGYKDVKVHIIDSDE